MSQEIQYTSDRTGGLEKMQGSDGRANVSSRSDSRGAYNSRDEGQTYSMPFDFQSAAAGEYGAYIKNTSSTGKTLVISYIGVNSVEASRIKLWFVTGTAAGGTPVIPTNLNKTSGNAATATAMEGGTAATGITGLSEDGLISPINVPAADSGGGFMDDRVRLGQNDAIALEYDTGTTGDFSGVIFGYFE